MEIVIGSGPAGLAVATALLNRGRSVTLVDGGRALPAEAQARKDEFSRRPAADWSAEDKDAWRAPQFAPSSDRVHRYGSDHAQEPLGDLMSPAPNWLATRASRAVGGLSNVWGAAILPNRQADISDWPISVEDLKPHYAEIAKLVPMSGRNDRLADLFPAVSMENCQPLRPGPQGQALLDRLDAHGETFQAAGIFAGQARQAVSPDCQYCGLCLHGCPWDQIFSAAHGLEMLKSNQGFRYLSGHLVQRYQEEGDGVTLYLEDGATLSGERIFVAAGILESARIILRSLSEPGNVRLKDSRHFFLPFLHAWSPKQNPETSAHHTLTEAFLEIDDPDVSPFLTHTQIYGWNAFYAREMVANYGSKLPGSAPVFKWLSRRLMVAQTFVHSAHCPEIELSLSADKQALQATLVENPELEVVMRAARKKLSKQLQRVGLHALGFASRLDAAGASFHSGGTFPMAQSPRALQTNDLGRLHGSQRVHLVDASVLPSIPATTITLSVMANAHRIGSLA